MFDVIEAGKTLVGYIDEGDLMSALSYFEGEIRPNVMEMETNEHQEIVDLFKSVFDAIDNEEWHAALETAEKVRGIIYG